MMYDIRAGLWKHVTLDRHVRCRCARTVDRVEVHSISASSLDLTAHWETEWDIIVAVICDRLSSGRAIALSTSKRGDKTGWDKIIACCTVAYTVNMWSWYRRRTWRRWEREHHEIDACKNVSCEATEASKTVGGGKALCMCNWTVEAMQGVG
jgi:hypothetical protein